MINGEHTVLKKETYDGLMTQERLFKESEDEYKTEIKNLKDRDVVAEIKVTKRNIWGEPLESFLLIKSDSKLIQASFDELKQIHRDECAADRKAYKEQIDKLTNRNWLQRLINKKS
jgi:hypothetical protein